MCKTYSKFIAMTSKWRQYNHAPTFIGNSRLDLVSSLSEDLENDFNTWEYLHQTPHLIYRFPHWFLLLKFFLINI